MFSLMARRPVLLLALGLALFAPGAAAELDPAPLTLTLRSQVQLGRGRIVLDDVAALPAGAPAALGRLDLGAAPRVNAVEHLTREQLALAIRRRLHQTLPALAWDGADSVSVQSMSQTVSGADLGQAAVRAVLATYGPRFAGLEAATPIEPADVDIVLGAYTVKARALAASQLPARAAVWLDLLSGAQVLRSVVVPVALTWRRPHYLARRTLAGGAVVGPSDFEVREDNVAGMDPQPVVEGQGGWRLRRAMRAGQVLTRDLLPVAGTVFPGDRIRVQTRSGAIGIEVEAVVQAEAAPGQLVAVRAPNSSDTLTGRLTAAGNVVVE